MAMLFWPTSILCVSVAVSASATTNGILVQVYENTVLGGTPSHTLVTPELSFSQSENATTGWGNYSVEITAQLTFPKAGLHNSLHVDLSKYPRTKKIT